MLARIPLALVVALCVLAAAARAGTVPQPALAAPPAAGFSACARAIAAASAAVGLPPGLLAAVATVESGRPDPRPSIFRHAYAPPGTAARRPWPWTINAGGVGRYFTSRRQAIEAVRALQAQGVTAIDIGCLQVDLRDHPRAFASLRQAFDPEANARYAAGFLIRLHAALGTWKAAVAAYHSQTPALGLPYQRLVAARWRSLPPAMAQAARPVYADFQPVSRKYADFATLPRSP